MPLHFTELQEQQKRQFLDAESLHRTLQLTEEEAWRHRGSMFWREQGGRTYLIKLSPESKQRSLGPLSEQTREIHDKFMSRKSQLESRLRDLRAQSETARRLNRALRVGRTPDILVDVLNVLSRARVAEHFLLVGTNALYAYETAAGVRFPQDVMETRDADFLFDTSRRAQFLSVMQGRGESFIDLLRRADKTFERHPQDNYTAVNSRGYEVDLLRRFPPPELETSEHPLRMTEAEDDLWAVRASTGQRLLTVPRFSQVVVGTNGAMAVMNTVHPLAFARIKGQLAQDSHREPLKAKKDAQQAIMVEELVREYLPQYADNAYEPGLGEHDVTLGQRPTS